MIGTQKPLQVSGVLPLPHQGGNVPERSPWVGHSCATTGRIGVELLASEPLQVMMHADALPQQGWPMSSRVSKRAPNPL